MRLVAAAMASLAVLALVSALRPEPLVDRIRPYLRIGDDSRTAPAASAPSRATGALRRAGLPWTGRELRIRRMLSAASGAVAGLVAAQSGAFTAGPQRSAPALATLGIAAGLLAFRIWLRGRTDRRAARLRLELPVIADLLALEVIAGSSIAGAVESIAARTRGVAAEELAIVAADHRDGAALDAALREAANLTADPVAERLYRLLANAHVAGGRVADALAALAVDYRAALHRDLTTQGGKKALATYGPILALMVPVTLLFLMYPTLMGLRRLAGSP